MVIPEPTAPERAPAAVCRTAAMRRRMLVIYNPTAGLRRYKRLERVIEALRRYGCSVELRVTGAPGHASMLAKGPLVQSADALAVAGGDGTIAETVAGLAGSNVPLGIIPLGTANVLATEIGMDSDLDLAARALVHGPAHRVYIGTANERCFVMMAGAGFDAHVVAGIDLGLKRRIGKGAYALGAVQALFTHADGRYTVVIDRETHHCASVIVAKGRHYGGAFVTAPQADIGEPMLYACLFERPGALNVIRYGLGIMRGRLAHYPDVKIIPTRHIHISGSEGEPLQCDGDILTRLPADIRLGPAPINLIYPD